MRWGANAQTLCDLLVLLATVPSLLFFGSLVFFVLACTPFSLLHCGTRPKKRHYLTSLSCTVSSHPRSFDCVVLTSRVLYGAAARVSHPHLGVYYFYFPIWTRFDLISIAVLAVAVNCKFGALISSVTSAASAIGHAQWTFCVAQGTYPVMSVSFFVVTSPLWTPRSASSSSCWTLT